MTERQELILKEIEELRENYFQGINERKKEEERIYEEKKVEIERWKKLREEGQETIFPIERITELKKIGKEELEKFEKAIKEKMLNDLSSWALDPQGFFYRVDEKLKVSLVGDETNRGFKDSISFYDINYKKEIVNGFINEIKQNPQDWKIEEEENAIHCKNSWGGCFVVKHKSGRKHYRPFPLGYKNGHRLFFSFSDEEWAEIENALNYNKNDMPMPIIRKCGFSDCEKKISWEKTECNDCWNRKENYVCDACCQKQSYNIAFLIGVRDNLNDTEIALKRVRGLITKLPKFYYKLKEVEKSLILTVAEEEAIEKKKSFRINFLHEKNHGRQQDNIHLFKLCRPCLDELIKKEEQFTQKNLDVKKMGEKWEKNRFKHSGIFRQIADEIGLEEWKRICDENNKELGLKVEEEKNSEKEKLPEHWPCPNHQEEEVWEMLEGYIKGDHGKEDKSNEGNGESKPQQDKNFNNLTQEELNQKIQKLKTEIKELETNQNIINSPEWQIELKNKKAELEELEKLKASNINHNSEKNSSNNNFPTGWVVSGGILTVVGLTALLVIRKSKKRKQKN